MFAPVYELGALVVNSSLLGANDIRMRHSIVLGLPDSGEHELISSFDFQQAPSVDSEELAPNRSRHAIFLGLYR